jgi:hypothetical protein
MSMGNGFTLERLQAQSRWMMAHLHNKHSQFGEDGLIAKALERIPDWNRWCVEFGAWDGQFCSNTFRLVSECEFRAVLIEEDSAKYHDLQTKYPHPDRAIMLNAMVGFSAEDGLDSLLAATAVPRDFDLLSIDVDGNDYYCWESVESYRPKLVIVEYNPTMTNTVEFVQEKRPSLCEGSSALALVNLARRKGYELIARNSINLLFVVSEYFERFGIPDNSLAVMRDDSGCPQIYVGGR